MALTFLGGLGQVEVIKMRKWIPIIGFLSFFLINLISGILLISGIVPPLYYEDPPLYIPLTYLDLIFLIGLNLPSLIIVAFAIVKTKNSED